MSQQSAEVRCKVVGTVGLNGSGKDALIRYLEGRCGLTVLSLGDVARELAHLEGVSSSRDKLHEISQKYMDKYGEDFFVKVLIEEIDNKFLEKVGVTGVRTPTDVAALRQHFGVDFLLIHVKVDNPKLRFERLQKRGEARDPQNYEDFIDQEKTEKDLFHLHEAVQLANVTISNAGALEEFHQEIDQLLARHQFFRDLDCQA